MPITASNQRTFHRILYSGQNETITLLKRGPDQRQGTVVKYTLYDCRPSMMTKTGETIQGDMLADHRRVWHIPRIELDRNKITYINPADRIVDNQNRYWQPEATTEIDIKLMEQHTCINCLRIDPPDLVLQATPDKPVPQGVVLQ